jgi:hypothetical protein
MRRLGESEYEYVERLKREDGGDPYAFLKIVLLLPEWITLPITTIILVGLAGHMGALNVAGSYYLIVNSILLAMLIGIYYFKKKFKLQLLKATKGTGLGVALEHILYGESFKAKQVRLGVYMIWVLVFIWIIPY